jgi:hypothetical protein
MNLLVTSVYTLSESIMSPIQTMCIMKLQSKRNIPSTSKMTYSIFDLVGGLPVDVIFREVDSKQQGRQKYTFEKHE